MITIATTPNITEVNNNSRKELSRIIRIPIIRKIDIKNINIEVKKEGFWRKLRKKYIKNVRLIVVVNAEIKHKIIWMVYKANDQERVKPACASVKFASLSRAEVKFVPSIFTLLKSTLGSEGSKLAETELKFASQRFAPLKFAP